MKINDKKDLWNGKQYKANSGPQGIRSTAILNSINFKGNETVLDIGCGDGKVTKKLCSLIPNGEITGIDPSPSMIQETNTFTEKNINFFEQQAENFSFDKKFDYIFSFHCLHWIQDKLTVFKNVYKHLKPGGAFIFIISGRENPNIASVFNTSKWQKLMSNYEPKYFPTDKDNVKSMLLETGFSIDEIKDDVRSHFYLTKEDLVNWLMGWVPFATGFEKNNAISFSNEIAQNIVNESVGRGIAGKIEYKTEMLIIKAIK